MRISGLVIASLIASAPLAAQNYHWIGVLSGVQFQLGDSRGAQDAPVGGTTYGQWFPGGFGVNVTVHSGYIGATGSSPYAPGGSQVYASTTVLYNFYSSTIGVFPVKFYAKAGPGWVTVHSTWSNYWGSSTTTTRPTSILGAGAQLHVPLTPTRGWMYGAEIQMQSFYPSDPFHTNYHEWPFLVTAAYTW